MELVEVAFVCEFVIGPYSFETFDKFSAAPGICQQEAMEG